MPCYKFIDDGSQPTFVTFPSPTVSVGLLLTLVRVTLRFV